MPGYSQRTNHINAPVVVKTMILGGNKSIDNMWRNFLVGYIGSIFEIITIKNHPVPAFYLRGNGCLRIFEILDRGKPRKKKNQETGEQDNQDTAGNAGPAVHRPFVESPACKSISPGTGIILFTASVRVFSAIFRIVKITIHFIVAI